MAPKTADSARAKDRQFVTALARGMQLLQCFTPATPALSISELARRTSLPQPTVWRLCHTLVELGFLVPDSARQTLRPGIPLLTLGFAVLADQSVADLALPDVQDIAQRYQGAVSLGARDGLNMVYLQRCQGSQIILADLRVGSRVPMGTSATGWAYLAGLDDKARGDLLAQLRKQMGPSWRELEPRLRQALDAFEDTGYVINTGSLHPLINSVAVPVRGPNGGTLLSLSSGGMREQFNLATLRRIGLELRELAGKLAPMLRAGP